MNNVKSVNIQYLPNPEEIDSSKPLKAGKFLWPGFTHVYEVFAKQLSGGRYRYQTGLVPEEAPEEKREEIAQALAELEAYYGKGQLDPFNVSFWRDIKLKLDKKNMFLDIANNPEHKLLYYVIKGGGLQEVAASYDEAVDGATTKRWFMVEPEHLANINALDDRTINKALYSLTVLDEEKTFDDMFLVHKALVSTDRGTTKQTPRSALYKDLSDFIYGKISKTDKRKTPKQFVETFKLISEDKQKLFITAYVRDAVYFNFLTTTEDGQLQNIETKTRYGTTVQKAIQYLSNPANQDELDNIKERVEKKWSE